MVLRIGILHEHKLSLDLLDWLWTAAPSLVAHSATSSSEEP